LGALEDKTHVLRSALLEVTVAPEEGGRISSIRSLQSGVEFLAQPYQARLVQEPSLAAKFEHGICAGIEECLPSVGPSSEGTEGGAVPDHGDFWQMPWQVTHSDSSSLACCATGFSRPLHFAKTATVRDNILTILYRVRNLGTLSVSFLYACHPLLAIEPEDRVLLPPEVSTVSVDYSRDGRAGKPGDETPWPTTKNLQRLDVVLPKTAGSADMLYTQRLREGRCGLYRVGPQQGMKLHFDTARLPFLGIWLCYGGWPHPPQLPLQYAVALEPTSAPANTLDKAQQAGMATDVLPGEDIEWTIRFEVSEAGIGLQEFWP
jgi:galactose mutarotase-like enzyme